MPGGKIKITPYFYLNFKVIYLMVGVVVGAVLAWYICHYIPNKKIKKVNEEIEQKQADLEQDIKFLIKRKEDLTFSNEVYEKQIENFKKSAQDNLDTALELEAQKFQQSKEEYEKEYLQATKDAAMAYMKLAETDKNTYEAHKKELDDKYEVDVTEYNNKILSLNNNIKATEDLLAELKNKARSATEASKLAELEKNKELYYKLQLTDVDLEEVNKFRSIENYFRDPTPLNKVIWKTYFQKPYNDLMSRLMGSGTKMGIYKITDLTTQKCYIGQSVDIKTRLSNHIKAGLGIDGSNNKLYTAMRQHGVENFRYEILEECEQSKLNKEEKYWINFYNSDIDGLNMTIGGAKK